ncbi:MAG TPA: methyltransferase domain-containing protein [Tepidisphaeraceae bacterium]|nr:methyltransferase domain-containing protein [Tepidisphaeraceae bacterium]
MSTETSNAWDAKLYDDKHSFVWKFGADLIELLSPKSGERILDIGCGTGHLTKQIVDCGATVIGIDRSADMIAKAKAEFPKIEFEISDATDFHFDQPFDAAFSNAALHWVKPPERAVACISRALVPGGKFVAEFGGKGNVAQIEQAMAAASRDLGEPLAPSPWYFPSIPEYSTLMEQHRMEVTFATLFERPTPLEGPDGIQQWVRMFGQTFLAAMPQAKQEEFLERVAVHAKPALFQDGKWIADYRRLRIVARKRA